MTDRELTDREKAIFAIGYVTCLVETKYLDVPPEFMSRIAKRYVDKLDLNIVEKLDITIKCFSIKVAQEIQTILIELRHEDEKP